MAGIQLCHARTLLHLLLLSRLVVSVVEEHFVNIDGIRHVIRLGEVYSWSEADEACKTLYGGLPFTPHKNTQVDELNVHFITVRPTLSNFWTRTRTPKRSGYTVSMSRVELDFREQFPRCVSPMFTASQNTTVLKSRLCNVDNEIICSCVEEPFSYSCAVDPAHRVPCLTDAASVTQLTCWKIGCCYTNLTTPNCYHSSDTTPGYDRVPGYIEETPIAKTVVTNLLECADSCSDEPLCTAFTWINRTNYECWQYHNGIAAGFATADDLTFYAASYFKHAVSGWSCIEGQCNPDETPEVLALTAQTYGPKDCFEQCEVDENCVSVEVSVSTENQTCNMHTEHCPTGYPRVDTPARAARKVCNKGPVLRDRNHHYEPLAVLSDGNDTTCVNAASVSPSMEYMILHFPWPSWDWNALSSHSTEVRFKLVMDVGLQCAADYSQLPWYEKLEEIPLEPEVHIYTTDQSYDPFVPVDPSSVSFKRCRVYQKEREGNDVRICFFKCTCPTSECHSAFMYLPDKTLKVCELSTVP